MDSLPSERRRQIRRARGDLDLPEVWMSESGQGCLPSGQREWRSAAKAAGPRASVNFTFEMSDHLPLWAELRCGVEAGPR